MQKPLRAGAPMPELKNDDRALRQSDIRRAADSSSAACVGQHVHIRFAFGLGRQTPGTVLEASKTLQTTEEAGRLKVWLGGRESLGSDQENPTSTACLAYAKRGQGCAIFRWSRPSSFVCRYLHILPARCHSKCHSSLASLEPSQLTAPKASPRHTADTPTLEAEAALHPVGPELAARSTRAGRRPRPHDVIAVGDALARQGQESSRCGISASPNTASIDFPRRHGIASGRGTGRRCAPAHCSIRVRQETRGVLRSTNAKSCR